MNIYKIIGIVLLMMMQTAFAESQNASAAQQSSDWLQLAWHEDTFEYPHHESGAQGNPLADDGDGVPKGEDHCPGTPKGMTVDSKGCSGLVDNDQDGVPNSHDHCPNTRFGARIDAKGCELNYDLDADGVPNSRDQCPGTPIGQRVDINGCHKSPDSDRDGVNDVNDRCPGTPKGQSVDATGCPLIQDRDRDGVPDNRDACPNSVPGARVDARGCVRSLDTDRDGVSDNRDACPNSVPGAKVDRRGCRVAAVASFNNALFDSSSADLRADSEAEMRRALRVIRDLPRSERVVVEGHADSSGDATFNQKLSEARANTIANYLIRNGVSRDRLVVRGYGSSRPVASNATPESRKRNRRVELHLMR